MAKTQKNKATAKHLGLLKAKLAKLKAELVAGPVSLLAIWFWQASLTKCRRLRVHQHYRPVSTRENMLLRGLTPSQLPGPGSRARK
jgi:hypothetical protein